MALQPSRQVELQQHNVDLPRLDARGANQFVDVDGARAQGFDDALPFALADIRKRGGREGLV